MGTTQPSGLNLNSHSQLPLDGWNEILGSLFRCGMDVHEIETHDIVRISRQTQEKAGTRTR